MSVCLYVFVICIYLPLGGTPTSQILVENTVRVERSKLELTFGAPARPVSFARRVHFARCLTFSPKLGTTRSIISVPHFGWPNQPFSGIMKCRLGRMSFLSHILP